MQRKPSFQTTEPSSDMVAFLNRVEGFDPNAPDIAEDDNNAGWGHYQFTSGALTCANVLTSWQDIGNTDVACRLIAAAIKTCKVARHLCFSRNIHPNSYLSDAYLTRVIDLLWTSWNDAGGASTEKDAGGPSTAGTGEDAGGMPVSTSY
jgi:hypothetical protein